MSQMSQICGLIDNFQCRIRSDHRYGEAPLFRARLHPLCRQLCQLVYTSMKKRKPFVLFFQKKTWQLEPVNATKTAA